MFDIPAEAARRGWNEHELTHFVFEHGVSQGLRMAEFYLGDGHVRSEDRQGGDVFDLPREAAQRGWDEHELVHLVFEHGEEEGMNLVEMHLGDGDDSSEVFQCGVLHEPRVLDLDEVIPVEEVRQAYMGPEPAKNIRILFRGQQGLGVWKLAVGQSLEEWHAGGKVTGGSGGYFTTVGGKILEPAVDVGALGVGGHVGGGFPSWASGWWLWRDG